MWPAKYLATPRLVVDENQKTVWRWDNQEPFGNNPANEDPDGDGIAFDLPLRLPGQYYDRETNLAYNYFRDYDPGIGRYVQSDPIGLSGGLNTYAYGVADPLRVVDPMGLLPEWLRKKAPEEAIKKSIGGIAGRKCADNITCAQYKAPPYLLDTWIHDQCQEMIVMGARGAHYLECTDACRTWLRLKCNPAQGCVSTDQGAS